MAFIAGVEAARTNYHWQRGVRAAITRPYLLERANVPALVPTPFTARITWLGHVPSRAASLRAVPSTSVDVTLDGFPGEDHGGATRASCVRVKTQYPQGTEIRNVRQLTILSAEELAQTAEKMGLDTIDPAWVGASMIIEGIPAFTRVPPSSRLMSDGGVGITIDMENLPCIYPGKEIEAEAAGFGKLYKPAARGRRGVTAWVEHGGRLAIGDTLTLHVPGQPAWPHLKDL